MSTAGPLALPSPVGVATEGAVARIVRSPALFCLVTLTITATGLALDHFANLGVQMLLALCTWGFLAIAFVYLTPMERAQTSVVVVVATCAEIIGSVIWGVYTYRLGNLPLFVPPGHGLVYLTGLRLSQTPWFRERAGCSVAAAMACVGAWALLGLTALDRPTSPGRSARRCSSSSSGAAGRRQSTPGCSSPMAFLEIYGAAIGTSPWAGEIPGLGVPDGNPPSGAARLRVLDISALALAPACCSQGRSPWSLRALRDGRGTPGVSLPSHPAERDLGRPLGRGGAGVLRRRGDHRLPPRHRDLPADVGKVGPRSCSRSGGPPACSSAARARGWTAPRSVLRRGSLVRASRANRPRGKDADPSAIAVSYRRGRGRSLAMRCSRETPGTSWEEH